MKSFFQKSWLFMIMLCVSVCSYASDFEFGGLGYTITSFTDLECMLTSVEDATITNVQIPDYVNYSDKQLRVIAIGAEAFSGNENVTKVIVGDNVVTIGYGAFKNCLNLSEVTMNSNLESIEGYAFQGCALLESIIFPSSVKVGEGMFKNCSSLNSFIFPNETEEIPSNFFFGCISLTNLTIPSKVQIIGNNAFDGCVSISELTIPSNVKSIGSGAFNGCTALEKLDIEETDESLKLSYSTCNHHTTAPTYGEYFGLFEDCPIKSLIIGRQLEFTSSLNFVPYKETANGYNQMRDIHYPPFCNKSLDELIILPSTKVLPHDLFYQCKLTGKLEIKDDMNPLLVGAILTNTHKNGGSSTQGVITVYNNFDKFTPNEVYIGRDVQYYNRTTGYSGGYYDTPWMLDGSNLECYKIGDDVTSGYPKVKSPQKLRKLVVGENVKELHSYLCENAENLIEVQLGNSIVNIGKKAFAGCKSLSCISFPVELSIIDESAFYDCVSLSDINFNNYTCDIASNVFSGCSSIKTISIHGTLPNISSEFSNNVYLNCKLIVPNEEYANVENSDIWKNFWNVETSESLSTYIYENGLRYRFYTDTIGNNLAVLQSSMCEQRNVIIPEYVTSQGVSYRVVEIENNAFQNDDIIEYLNIPNSVNKIGNNAFACCSNLQHLIIDDSKEPLELGYSSLNIKIADNYSTPEFSYYGVPVKSKLMYLKGLFCDTPLKNIYIGRTLSYKRFDYEFEPSSSIYLVDRLFTSPFADLKSLEKIEIGENTLSLCSTPIYNPQNNAIYWPVATFVGCEKILAVQTHAEVPPTDVRFSESTYNTAILSVPDNTIDLYRNSDGWKDFIKIIDESSAGICTTLMDNTDLLTIAPNGIVFIGDTLAMMSIYTIDGRLIYESIIHQGDSVSLKSGLYIIKVNDKSYKMRI